MTYYVWCIETYYKYNSLKNPAFYVHYHYLNLSLFYNVCELNHSYLYVKKKNSFIHNKVLYLLLILVCDIS